MERYLRVKFLGTGLSSYEKGIYRAAVPRSLRNTGISSLVDVRIYKTNAAIWPNKTCRQNTSWHRPDCWYGCIKNTIPLHAQVFLRMNMWLFTTCRRQYNLIKSVMKMCAFCWFLLHMYITRYDSKNAKTHDLFHCLFLKNHFIKLCIVSNWIRLERIFTLSMETDQVPETWVP